MPKRKTTFKRLVSNLPYNPSLINQVSFYAKRLKDEASVRRLGFLFMALTLFVQMFAVIAPPTPSSAQDVNNDLIPGGFSTPSRAIAYCDDGSKDFGAILANYGITCDNLRDASTQTIRSTDNGGQLYSMGRLPYGKPGEYPVNISGRTYYMRLLHGWDSGAFSTYKVLSGTSSNGMPFMILYNCGNLVVVGKPVPPPPPPAPKPVKTLNCSILLMDHYDNSTIKKGERVTVLGQVTGTNLPPGQLVDFAYDYVDANTGKPMVSPVNHRGVAFKGAAATDTAVTVFTFNTPGRYNVRLAATADNGAIIPGSFQGQCLRTINVEQPPIDVCKDIPGTQTNEEQCKPCKDAPYNDNIACVILAKTVSNDTQKIADADGTEAKGGDTLTYTLYAKNTGTTTVKRFVVQENISDILDYADVVDLHGGTLGSDNVVKWPATDIKAGQTIQKKITVKVKNPIPQTPVSSANPEKFNLVMTNVYGNPVNVKLPPSIPKTTEQLTTTLPNTGPGTNMLIAFTITAIIGYFFARSRLLAKELTLVSQEVATGV